MGTFRVWQRNMDTFFKLWKTESWPPFVDPLINLIAIGYGVGAYITGIGNQTYVQFITPGIVASSVMFSSSLECIWGTWVRMTHERTFDAILATPISLEQVVRGELLYGATRGSIAGLGVLLVASILGLVSWTTAVLMLPVTFLAGLMFSALAVAYTAWVPSRNAFNYYFTLGITPMFMFSGVFFPIEQLPTTMRRLSWLSPLSHVVRPFRDFARGSFDLVSALHLAAVAALTAIFIKIATNTMRHRLIH